MQKLNQGKKLGYKIHQVAYQKHSCTAQSGLMGKRKDGNHSPQKNDSIKYSVGNEENGYPVPDLNKTMINVTKEPSDAPHFQKKKPSKKKSLRNTWRRF
jgi:hypothetical protein